MSTSTEDTDTVLKGFGLTRDTEGEHLDAWKAFWGAKIELQEQPVWKQWVDALKPHKRNILFTDMAMASDVFANLDDAELPSCKFLATPWKDALKPTDGRIMVTDDYQRLEIQVLETIPTTGSHDVVIAGQSGSGRTYLAYYLLACALARRQSMLFFAENRVVVFSPLGVFSTDRLNVHVNTSSKFDKAIGGEPLALVDVSSRNDEFGPPEEMFFSIRTYPPSSRRYENWIVRNHPDVLVLDALSSRLTIAAATLQLRMKPTRQCLQQLLTCLLVGGLNLRSSLSLDSSVLRASLHEYIISVPSEKLLGLAENARFSPYAAAVLRVGDDPDIFVLRRDITTFESCLPTIASRYVISELASAQGLSGLSALGAMEVVQRCPDGLSYTKTWLFEFICHTLLSSGSSEHATLCVLSQCFPSDAPKRKGALTKAHICAPRKMEHFDPRSSPPRDTNIYHIVETLADDTLHAVVHARATRGSPKFNKSTASSLAETEQRRKLRPRVRTAEVVEVGPSKRRKLPIDRRFVVLLQVVSGRSPHLSEDGLRRLEEIMRGDVKAEYFFVFVTAKDVLLDLNAVPFPWMNRLKWYQLSVDVDLPSRLRDN